MVLFGWFIGFLFLQDRLGAEAIRLDVDSLASAEEGARAFGKQEVHTRQVRDEEVQSRDEFKAAVAEGHRVLEAQTCEDLQVRLAVALSNAHIVLTSMCQPDCGQTASWEIQENLLSAGELVMAASAAADENKCLAACLAAPEVQEELRILLSMAQHVLRSGHTPEANSAMALAWEYLVAWQQGTLDLADERLERRVVFPEDVEGNCPQPCYHCSREHNSMFKGEEAFRFKCYLKHEHREEVPQEPGIICERPTRRTSRFWRPWRWNEWKTWCDVEGWKDTACSQAKVTALLSCGAAAIVNPLREAFLDIELMHKRCVEYEQGGLTDPRSLVAFQRQLQSDYNVVLPQHNLAFGVFLSAGLSSGLGALRWASRSNSTGTFVGEIAQPADLLESFKQGQSVNQEMRRIFNGSEFDSCETLVDRMASCKVDWRRRRAESALQTSMWWQHFVASALFGVGVGGLVFASAASVFWAIFSLLGSLGITSLSAVSGLPAAILGVVSLLSGLRSFSMRQRAALLDSEPACPSWNWGRATWDQVIKEPIVAPPLPGNLTTQLPPVSVSTSPAPTEAPATSTPSGRGPNAGHRTGAQCLQMAIVACVASLLLSATIDA